MSDSNSKYFDPNAFDNIAEDIAILCDEFTPLVITGDMNGRSGSLDDNFNSIKTNNANDVILPMRKNCDQTINEQGKSIIELCRISNLSISNGRFWGDLFGNFTFSDSKIGASSIDYSFCDKRLKDLVSKKKIGLRKGCRTADHLLTLKTIVNKYITKKGDKLYTCFVDFQKALDSVGHTGLFKEPYSKGLNGKLLNLLENIYKKTTCTVKYQGKYTDFSIILRELDKDVP